MNNNSSLRVAQRATACVLSLSVLVMISGCFKTRDGEGQKNSCDGVSKKLVWLKVNWNLDNSLGDGDGDVDVSDFVDLNEKDGFVKHLKRHALSLSKSKCTRET